MLEGYCIMDVVTVKIEPNYFSGIKLAKIEVRICIDDHTFIVKNRNVPLYKVEVMSLRMIDYLARMVVLLDKN